MLISTGRINKEDKDWVIIGHKKNYNPEVHPLTPRAVYPFQSRLKHLDTRKAASNKNHSYDCRFPFNSAFNEVDFYKKFPIRKSPQSVKSKRSVQFCIDILGTQLIYLPNKKYNRYY